MDVLGKVVGALVGVGGVTLAVHALWKFVVRPLGRLDAEYPVWRDIAHEFKNNSGSSLRDAIDAIAAAVEDTKRIALAAQRSAQAAEQRADAAHLAAAAVLDDLESAIGKALVAGVETMLKQHLDEADAEQR